MTDKPCTWCGNRPTSAHDDACMTCGSEKAAAETKLAIAYEAFRFIGEIPNSEAAQGLMKVIARDATERMREIKP